MCELKAERRRVYTFIDKFEGKDRDGRRRDVWVEKKDREDREKEAECPCSMGGWQREREREGGGEDK